MNENKRFAELAGVPCHTWETKGMDKKMHSHSNPDFRDAREVLRVMREREDWREFILNYMLRDYVSFEQIPFWIDHWFLDTTGKLRDLAIEWMEERKEAEDELL